MHFTYSYNARLTDWRDAIKNDVISAKTKKSWEPSAQNLKKLEEVLTMAICDCAESCLKASRIGIAMTLSGGLDSSFCLWVIRKNFSLSKISTFTIGLNESHPDIVFAREMARLCKTEHHEIIPTKFQIDSAKRIVASLWPGEEKNPGNAAVLMAYQHMAENGVSAVIAHDGIDEQLGGYPEHRCNNGPEEKKAAFRMLWDKLETDHLLPLQRKADHFGVGVIFPYLQKRVIKHTSRIPLDMRTSRDVSKIPLREIASSKKDFPRSIIERKKIGFCCAFDEIVE